MSVRDIWEKVRDGSATVKNITMATACVAIVVLAVTSKILPEIHIHLFDAKPDPNVVPLDLGWAGVDVAREATQDSILAGGVDDFRIVGADPAMDNATKRVVFWDATRLMLGHDLPVVDSPPPAVQQAIRSRDAKGADEDPEVTADLDTFRQVIGDCVGAGMKQSLDYGQYVLAYVRGQNIEPKPSYLPYHYAVGRNAPECGNGRLNRGRDPWDGSVGSWQAKAVQLYGWIPADTEGLEPYSASVVKRWAVRMPDAQFLTLGKQHRVKTIALARSAEDVRDAICNGYPVTIASDWGGMMNPPTVDGKLVNKRVTSWAHQMCVIGYDGTGREPLWYILNSWGPRAHGTPPDDAPPGGFWVRRRDMQYIVGQDDTWILSDIDGFPANDWVIIRARMKNQGVPEPSSN